jgi:hypothetical protein
MKRVLVILAFLLITGLLLPFSGDNKLYAVSGCCKERNSYDAGWRPNGMNFKQCETHNQSRDGDNVFRQRGLVWWDAQCK